VDARVKSIMFEISRRDKDGGNRTRWQVQEWLKLRLLINTGVSWNAKTRATIQREREREGEGEGEGTCVRIDRERQTDEIGIQRDGC